MAPAESSPPVWQQTTTSGFHQRVFIMYHATETPESAESILVNGFKPSSGKYAMLGAGVYVSKNPDKTHSYGPITFRLLVYPGRVCKVTSQNDPMRKKWQHHHSSAWVPPKCGMVESEFEENCIKCPDHIEVVGVTRGYHLLSKKAKQLTINMPYVEANHVAFRYTADEDKLDGFIERIGIDYFRLYNATEGCYVIDNPSSGKIQYVERLGSTATAAQLWTITEDCMIENKHSGMKLFFCPVDLEFQLRDCPESQEDWRAYKWRHLSSGALIDRWSKLPIVFDVIKTTGVRGRAGKRFNPRLGDSHQQYDEFEFHYNFDRTPLGISGKMICDELTYLWDSD